MKVVTSLGNLQASCRGNCWDPAYSKAQPFHQPAESEPCCAALHYKQYAFCWFCLFLMNSEVITPHWKYIGAAIKICSCILISLSRLKISRLSSNNLLELQLKQKGFNSLQPYLVQRAWESSVPAANSVSHRGWWERQDCPWFHLISWIC